MSSPPHTRPEDVPTGVEIGLESLSFGYPGGPNVLSDISATIEAGERVGLLGPSGAGKSTFLLHLNGLLPEPPVTSETEAQVRINRQPLTVSLASTARQLVGLLFQNPDDQLFHATVGRDVAFGPLHLGLDSAEIEARVTESLAQVGLEDFADRDTGRLSLGERKRACLAGLLACRPGCLALDEPFANLDPRGRQTLLEILKAFDGTLILATHDLDIISRLTDRVLVLDDGMLCADGETAQILGNDDLLKRHGLLT